MNNQQFRNRYKALSLAMSILFAVVGLIFLTMPADVLVFFNTVSRMIRIEETPVEGFSFYLILAVGYMYLVSLLAYMMFLHPENKYFICILINGKSASSATSILLCALHRPYLIYATNGVVDGLIAVLLIVVYRKLKAESA